MGVQCEYFRCLCVQQGCQRRNKLWLRLDRESCAVHGRARGAAPCSFPVGQIYILVQRLSNMKFKNLKAHKYPHALGVLLGAALVLVPGGAQGAAGVTDKEILIGSSLPLEGSF